MNHRLSNRQPLSLNIRIYRHGKFIAEKKTQNISSDGVFVETTEIKLPKHAAIAVEIHDPQTGWLKLPAIVSHVHRNGFGVMFASASHLSISELSSKSLAKSN